MGVSEASSPAEIKSFKTLQMQWTKRGSGRWVTCQLGRAASSRQLTIRDTAVGSACSLTQRTAYRLPGLHGRGGTEYVQIKIMSSTPAGTLGAQVNIQPFGVPGTPVRGLSGGNRLDRLMTDFAILCYKNLMASMNISLPDALEAYVQTKLASGGYTSASEVIREGLRLLQEQDRGRLHALRSAIKEGSDAAAAGRVVPLNDEISGNMIAERVRKRRRSKSTELNAEGS